MANYVSKSALQQALLQINGWHPNIPLMFVFSKQKQNGGVVDGGAQAVRSSYDDLFNLDRIGIRDEARKFFLHLCHSKAGGFPYALKKPTDAYGKTHQRIIKDTFGQNFLERISKGKYKLTKDFASKALKYFGLETKLDLQPLLLFYYWNNVGTSKSFADLWKKFSEHFGLNQSPFSDMFTCSGLEQALPTEELASPYSVKEIFLPDEYGVEKIDAEFWRRFRANLDVLLKETKWQGQTSELTATIASGLMNDQAIFLLGPPGTGKTTIVHDVILPALRKTYGTTKEIAFSAYTLTPQTTSADLLGFQGLDGSWIMGPLGNDLLREIGTSEEQQGELSTPEQSVPYLLFLDEANRVDIEGLLAPLQPAFDRMQRRLDPGTVPLGKSEYAIPGRVWRIFAGNSPVSDMGRREQSRPFKRRISLCITPDPVAEIVTRPASFRSLVFDLLERGSTVGEPEVAEPCLQLLGVWKADPDRIEDFRVVLEKVRSLPQVPVTVGLIESVLFRTASQTSLGRDLALDAALCQSLIGLIAGQPATIAAVGETAKERRLPQFADAITFLLKESRGNLSFDVNSIV